MRKKKLKAELDKVLEKVYRKQPVRDYPFDGAFVVLGKTKYLKKQRKKIMKLIDDFQEK